MPKFDIKSDMEDMGGFSEVIYILEFEWRGCASLYTPRGGPAELNLLPGFEHYRRDLVAWLGERGKRLDESAKCSNCTNCSNVFSLAALAKFRDFAGEYCADCIKELESAAAMEEHLDSEGRLLPGKYLQRMEDGTAYILEI